MGSVYRRKKKLPNGEYRELATWWVKYYRDGRAMRESTGTEKVSVARRILRSREAAVEHGLPVGPKVGRVSVEDAAKDLLNDYVANGRRSLASVKRRITKHLLPFFRGRRLASITTVEVRAYIAKRTADVITTGAGDTARTRPVSNAEINNELKVLSRMFSLAFEAAKVLHVPKIPRLAEHNARQGFFEPDQFTAMRAHLPEFLRPLVTFMFLTGWRISEVRSLEWRQVDFQAGEVRLEPGTTKNDEGRVFPFTTELRELLRSSGTTETGYGRPARWSPGYSGNCEANVVVAQSAGQASVRGRSDVFGRRGLPPVARPAAPDASHMISDAPPCGASCAPVFPSASRCR